MVYYYMIVAALSLVSLQAPPPHPSTPPPRGKLTLLLGGRVAASVVVSPVAGRHVVGVAGVVAAHSAVLTAIHGVRSEGSWGAEAVSAEQHSRATGQLWSVEGYP